MHQIAQRMKKEDDSTLDGRPPQPEHLLRSCRSSIQRLTLIRDDLVRMATRRDRGNRSEAASVVARLGGVGAMC